MLVLALIGILALLYLFFLRPISRRSQLPYPPGPKPIPYFGNAFQLPRKEQWFKYSDWSKRLASMLMILFLILGNRSMLVEFVRQCHPFLGGGHSRCRPSQDGGRYRASGEEIVHLLQQAGNSNHGAVRVVAIFTPGG